MPSKKLPGKLLGACLLLGLSGTAPAFAADELKTLFTTPQERQLINANRYKTDEVKQLQVVDEPDDKSPIQMLAQEEVSVDYRVSGISLATDGAHTAWINGVAYDDGARLDDGSRVTGFLCEPHGVQGATEITHLGGWRRYIESA